MNNPFKKKPSGPSTMYSGTLCDLCGGPTLEMKSGSIWCPDEDAHAGGHFVTRRAFERSPLKGGEIKGSTSAPVIKPRVPKAPVAAKPTQPTFAGGYDDFVGSDKS